MTELLIAAAAVLGLYALSVRGKKGHPGLAELGKFSYAHRGLHRNGIPENSLAAFRAAVENGYGSELDVHLLKDGTLAVMHDHLLERTTGLPGKIEDLTREELKSCFLEGTGETVPSFQEVLAVYGGKAPLIVELKATTENYARLTQAACQLLDGYEGAYCLESFDPRCIGWLKKHRPELIRGQLTENFVKSKGKLSFVLKLIMTLQLENFLTLPHFVAYKYADRKNLGNFLVRKLWGVQGVSWTLKTQEEYDTAVKEGYIPIFEGFIPQKS